MSPHSRPGFVGFIAMFARKCDEPIIGLRIQMLLRYCMSLKAALPIRGIVARATVELVALRICRGCYTFGRSYLGQTVA